MTWHRTLVLVRIAVADSNQMACRLLSEALAKQPGLSVVASVVDDEALLRSVKTLKPEIAVISAAFQGGPLKWQSGVQEVLGQTSLCPWILLLDHSEHLSDQNTQVNCVLFTLSKLDPKPPV